MHGNPGSAPLQTFSNLPMIGREAELRGLVDIWRAAGDAPTMQLAMLTGEAGAGKSRLLEEFVATVRAQRGAIVHVVLYPEASTSLVQPLAHAVGQLPPGLAPGRMAPPYDLASVVEAVARTTRLRRTALIIEDVHLLAAENRGEVHAILERLSAEQVLVVFAARPLTLAIGDIVDDYRPHRIVLSGLEPGAIRELLSHAISAPTEKLAATLHRLTAGNPLALRTALRSVARRETAESGESSAEEAIIENIAERSVELLSDAMVAHLTPGERESARRLAMFGKVVARETAIGITTSESCIATLVAKGILADTDSLVPALDHPTSASPLLVFTHSLLHRHFVESAPVDPELIVRIVAANLPLYSIQPFLLLFNLDEPLDVDFETAEAFIRRTLNVAMMIDATTDWRKSEPLLELANRLHSAIAPRIEPDRARRLRLAIVEYQLRCMRRMEWSERYFTLVQELLNLTANPATENDAAARIQALTHRYRSISRNRTSGYHSETWSEIDELCDRWPGLLCGEAISRFLRDVAHLCDALDDWATLRLVEQRVERIMGSEGLPASLRQFYEREIPPLLLRLFRTPEEVALRRSMLDRVLASPVPLSSLVQFRVVRFLFTTGSLAEARRIIDELTPRLLAQGLPGILANTRCYLTFGDAGQGRSLDSIWAEVEEIMATVPPSFREAFRASSRISQYAMAIMRAEYRWASDRELRNANTPENGATRELDLMLALLRREPAERLHAELELQEPTAFVTMAGALLSADATIESAIAETRRYLGQPRLSLFNGVDPHVVIAAIARAEAEHGWQLHDTLKDDVTAMVESTLAWHHERGLFAFIMPLVEAATRYLSPARNRWWAERASQQEAAHGSRHSALANDLVELAMFGTIEIRRDTAEPARPRGARIRTVLGLLVADHMVERPLEPREFLALAGGAERDHEDARNTVNVTIHRLREMLGHEAIINRNGKATLNLERVTVDLLRANELVGAAARAFREGALRHAYEQARTALELGRADVPFPTLYDDFFEALREDYEYRLRTAVMQIARELIGIGDAESAQDLLELGFDALPGDEEIAELLQRALSALGKQTEARRVSLRVAMADG